jgi:glycolate oxidase iron-sulfur subunit
MDASTIVDYAKSLDCVHCGLCLNSCPTYRLTGREASSPRGRIHLMRSVAEGALPPDADFAEEMDFCLLCRNCESVCPSGVRYGSMMEHTRGALEASRARPLWVRAARRIGFGIILRDRLALRIAGWFARIADRTGLGRRLGAPPLPQRTERALLPTQIPADGETVASVALMEGCVMPEIFGGVQRATAEVLRRAGCHVRVSPMHVCCGSLHAHNGELNDARALARQTIEAYERLTDDSGAPLPLIVNSAGCGSHLKELEHLFENEEGWKTRAHALSARTLDLSQFLAREPMRSRLLSRIHTPLAAHGPLAWDDPCHLCHGQGVRKEPREWLRAAAGAELATLADPESCCGSAGIYSLLRPADAAAVLKPRIEALAASGARVLVTSNPGCQLQWESGIRAAGLDVRVMHLAEALEAASR